MELVETGKGFDICEYLTFKIFAVCLILYLFQLFIERSKHNILIVSRALHYKLVCYKKIRERNNLDLISPILMIVW
jgi:hypothetical protein